MPTGSDVLHKVRGRVFSQQCFQVHRLGQPEPPVAGQVQGRRFLVDGRLADEQPFDFDDPPALVQRRQFRVRHAHRRAEQHRRQVRPAFGSSFTMKRLSAYWVPFAK